MILLGSGCVFLFSSYYVRKDQIYEAELFFLFLFVILGGCCLVFSNNFLGMYIGLELQGLSLYILATFRLNSTFSTESGLKYFVLGAFASSIIVFGIALIYGFTGTINLDELNLLFLEGTKDPRQKGGLIVAFLFLLLGLIFKVGGSPLHFWVPDVYQGIPSLILLFFAIVPKLGIFCFLLHLTQNSLLVCTESLYYVLLYSGTISILIGAVGALQQPSVKRLIAYSAIGHAGFLLYSLSFLNFEAIIAFSLYLTVYIFLLINALGILLSAQQRGGVGGTLKYIANLRFLMNSHPLLSISLCFSIFGMAGIPPLSGFFSKALIFLGAIKSSYIVSGCLCILISVVSVAYYLRLIRSLSFYTNKSKWLFFADISRVNGLLIIVTLFFNLFFVFLGESLLLEYYNLTVGFKFLQLHAAVFPYDFYLLSSGYRNSLF